jgi:DNA end-binding protein Ku
MHQREYIVIIRPRDNGLILHTVYYPDEVRAVPEFNRFKPAELKPQEIQLAEQLVKSLAGPFKPEQYEDEYRKRLIALVEAKAEGETVRGTPHKTKAPVIDLMQALKKSLAMKEKAAAKKPAESARTRKKAS